MPIDTDKHLEIQRKLAMEAPQDPAVAALVRSLVGRVADKWTMIVIDILAQHGELRFTRLSELVGNISQKVLTQTLREMEREGLVLRTIHPVVPPRVEYRLTDLGLSLGAAFCGVWIWAEENLGKIHLAREDYDKRNPGTEVQGVITRNRKPP